MAKVTITGFEKASAQVKLKAAKAIQQSQWPKSVAIDLVEEIRTNGIDPSLADSTIQNRERIARKNKTHKDYVSWFSNLTLSGQLLDSLKSKFVPSSFSISILSSDKAHKKYRPSKRSTPTLNQIFKYQKQMGRDILIVFERKSFVDKITRKLQSAIRTFYRN